MEFVDRSEKRTIPCPVCKKKVDLWTGGPFGFDTGNCKHCWITLYAKDKDLVWVRYEKKNRRYDGPLFFHIGYPFELSFQVAGASDFVPFELIEKVLSKIKESNK